jgi:4-amino-4-deoxy-L-arabinose transferase-like glycosyltransferase
MPLVAAAAPAGRTLAPAPEVQPSGHLASDRHRFRRWLVAALLLWGLAAVLVVPFGIGSSWRECDTQTIARNFLSDGFDPLRPRIDWRGDTDGAVECEFPLYQTMIASVMAVVGEAEWPGRVISLLAIAMATLSLHRLLERRTGPAGALIGALVFLSGGHTCLLGLRVTPDATSTAFALAGLAAFVQFLDSGRSRTLVLAAAMTTIACLTKPTALQIGLLQFLWLLCLAPRRLPEARLWISFAGILAIVGAWIVHGAGLHAETGLTFGVASGGETKFPTMRSLREPWIWYWLGVTTLQYGVSIFGFVGLVVLAVRRRITNADIALLLVVGLGLVGTLRYSHHYGVGPQYHVFAAFGGAWFAARAWSLGVPRLAWPIALAALVAAAAFHLHHEREFRQHALRANYDAVSGEVAALSSPTDLAVVHGHRERTDAFWRRRTNFEEPMLLYHARRRGWVLPRDGFLPQALTDLHRRGARVVVDQVPEQTPAESRAWLDANAEAVRDHAGQRIYRLRPQS